MTGHSTFSAAARTARSARGRARPRALSLLAGTILVALAAVSLAHGGGPDYPRSVTEAKDRAEARFQQLDQDRSGEVSLGELAAAPDGERLMSRHHHRHFRHRGHDHGAGHDDGTSSRAERWRERHAEMQAEVFERLDGNGDGLLSPAEFDRENLRRVHREIRQERLFARLDDDGSGGLSRDELPDASRRLAAMDSDGDGTVTREEAHTYRAARRDAWREAHHARRDARDTDAGSTAAESGNGNG